MRLSAFALLFLGSPAYAGTAGRLVAACNSQTGSTGEQLCNAYINGLADGVLADQIAREGGTAICFPNQITTQQLRDAILAYIDNKNTAILQIERGGVAEAALEAKYPCKTQISLSRFGDVPAIATADAIIAAVVLTSVLDHCQASPAGLH